MIDVSKNGERVVRENIGQYGTKCGQTIERK